MEINIYNQPAIAELRKDADELSRELFIRNLDESKSVFTSDLTLNPTPLRATLFTRQYLDSRWAFVFGENRDHVLQSAYLKPADLIQTILNKEKSRAVRLSPDTYYFLAYNHDFANYYHWLLQCYPSIVLYLSLRQIYNPIKLLLPQDIPDFALQYLKLLPIDLSKEVEFIPVQSDLFYADKLIYPSLLGGEFAFNPSQVVLDFMSNLFQRSIADGRSITGNTGKKRPLYLARLDSNNRKITNEERLISMLKTKYDANIAVAADYDVRGQAQLFHESDIIISPHGAGLSNMLFSRQGSTVIELTPDLYLNPCFATLGLNKGMHYIPLKFPVTQADGHQHNYKWTVDTQIIDETLITIIEKFYS